MKKNRHQKLFCFMVLFSICLIIFILPVSASAETPRYGGVLRIIEPSAPATPIGWPVETTGASAACITGCLELLIKENADGTLIPWLAESWIVAPDKSSITFSLRKGVKFHDGSDWNAEAAKFNLDAQLEKKQGQTKFWSSVEALDEYTVRINLSGGYENTVFTRLGYFCSKESVKKNGVEWARWNPVGTGPFKFTDFKRDVSATFTRFDDYWGGKPYLDGLHYDFISDPMTQALALEAGNADVLGLELGKAAYDLKNKGFVILAPDGGSTTITMIPDSANTDSPFSKLKVRQAIEYAVDREAIAKARGYGLWAGATQLVPIGNAVYNPGLEYRKYSPEKAKQLLAESGYPDGFDTKIILQTEYVEKDVAVMVQGFFSDIGINAIIEPVDNAKYNEYRFKGWKNSLILGACAQFSTIIRVPVQFYFAENSRMFVSLKRPAGWQALIDEAVNTIDISIPKVQAVTKVMHDEAMVIPLLYTARGYVVNTRVHDTNHMKFGVWTIWSPEKAWLSK